MTPEATAYIEDKIRLDYSPEQISGTMGCDLGAKISHERIYQHIYEDKAAGGQLYRHLRIASGKKRRKRYGRKDRRGRIAGRVSIKERPRVIEEKRRYGDWEADLVCGSRHQGFLVTLVERKSKYVLIGHVEHKLAEAVREEIVRILNGQKVRSITYDNGKEFAEHEQINEILNCQSFFAEPYHSWERGLNENTNGLIRQYFPKGMDLRNLSPEKIRLVQDRLNDRPRKTLGFKSPREVWARIG
jgi:IS30 family transposase